MDKLIICFPLSVFSITDVNREAGLWAMKHSSPCIVSWAICAAQWALSFQNSLIFR